METKKFDQNDPKQKGENNSIMNGAAIAGAAVIGAVAGVAGAEIAGHTGPEGEHVSSPGPNTQPMPTPVLDPQEPAELDPEPQPDPDSISTPTLEPTPEPEPIVTPEPNLDPNPAPEPNPESIPVQAPEPEPNQDPELAPTSAPGSNPETNDVVDVITGVQEIDPNDIDVANIINVDEIGTVYTVDGESLLAAAVHDQNGNDLLMVDVDGDEVFDVVTTYEGELISHVSGDIDISDAEHMMTATEPGYLAANEFDNNLDMGSDIQQDIIEA